jgi:hypothetical protein
MGERAGHVPQGAGGGGEGVPPMSHSYQHQDVRRLPERRPHLLQVLPQCGPPRVPHHGARLPGALRLRFVDRVAVQFVDQVAV